MKKIFVVLLLATTLFLLSGCKNYTKYDAAGRRVCPICGGAGYTLNGAKNAAEYAVMKKKCTTCNGRGYMND